MNTTSQDIIDSFDSTFQDKYVLSDGLIMQWLIDAIGEFELEIGDLNYDIEMDEFPVKLKQYQIKTLALLMKVSYLTRELSRINKISNIIGKDISLNGTGDTKRFSKAELESELTRVKDMLNKQKQHCFAN